jgi:hypothetical protein
MQAAENTLVLAEGFAETIYCETTKTISSIYKVYKRVSEELHNDVNAIIT